MKLGRGEALVKQYSCYHTSDGKSETLTVTNRRIIATHFNKLGKTQEEIRIKDVKSIDTGYGKTKIRMIAVGIIICILSIMFFAMGKIFSDGGEEEALIPCVSVGIIVAIIGALIALFGGTKVEQFYLYISTNISEGKAIASSVSTGEVSSKRKKFNNATNPQEKIKITIDKTSCQNIIEELGCIIFDLQTQKEKTEQI